MPQKEKKFQRSSKALQKAMRISMDLIEDEARHTAFRETRGMRWHRWTMMRYGKDIDGTPLDADK